MAVLVKDLKRGIILSIDNEPWLVQKTSNPPSGTNSTSKILIQFRNLFGGYVREKELSAEAKFDEATTGRKQATLSFMYDDIYSFMDTTTDSNLYELGKDKIPFALPYMEEGMEDICDLVTYDGKVVTVALPATVSRKVASINAGRARLANGTEVKVTDSVKVDDMIDIDTSDGSFKGLSKN